MKYWQAAESDYAKRIRRYGNLDMIAVKEAPQHALRNDDLARQAEADEIARRLSGDEFVIALDRRARQLSSEGLAEFLQTSMLHGSNRLAFVIGGPLGLSEDFLNTRANRILSLSEMTFPHEMAKVILVEQIYRALTILRGEPYHK